MHTESPDVDDRSQVPSTSGTLCLWRGYPSAGPAFPNECPCNRHCCLTDERYWFPDPFLTRSEKALMREVLDPVFRLLLGGAAGGEDGVG